MSIKNNTTSLQNILAKVNALPEAGEGGIDTSDATATADEIFAGETAYGANGKITGTFTIQEEVTTQEDLIAEIKTALVGKAGGGASQSVIEPITITNNGTFTAPQGIDGYSPITVNVAGSGSSSDEMTAFIEGHLVDLYNDSATVVADYIFEHNIYLETVKLPNVEYINMGAFVLCEYLKLVDLSRIQIIYSSAFQNCESLTSFIIRNTERVADLMEVYVFSSTPIADGTGYIYVPSVLLESYQSATNWSMYAEQFRPLEDYTSDGTVTGEFIPPVEGEMLPICILTSEGNIEDTGLYIIVAGGMTWGEWGGSTLYDDAFVPTEDGLVMLAYPLDENTYYAVSYDEGSGEFLPAGGDTLINWFGGAVVIMSAADLGLE